MAKIIKDRVIALAGIYQASTLVRQVAQQGKFIDSSVTTCLHSLFKVDANCVDDVYGGLNSLKLGLKTLLVQLGFEKSSARDLEITRYVLSLIYLERKLVKKTLLMDTLTAGIKQASQQAQYFSETHENVIAKLADIYQQTVSTLNPTITVKGDKNVLTNPDNANLIRALLLSGARSTILWRQCGGHRWQFLFGRAKIIQMATDLLDSIP